MSKTTTEATYEADLAEAAKLMDQFIDSEQCEGQGKKWTADALNDAWQDGIQITEWVARATLFIPASFRRSAA